MSLGCAAARDRTRTARVQGHPFARQPGLLTCEFRNVNHLFEGRVPIRSHVSSLAAASFAVEGVTATPLTGPAGPTMGETWCDECGGTTGVGGTPFGVGGRGGPPLR